MEKLDRQLSPEDRLWLIREALNNDSLSGVLEAVNNRFGLKEVIEEPVASNSQENIVASESDTLSQNTSKPSLRMSDFAGIYKQEHLHAVEEDLSEASSRVVGQTEQPKVRVLEQPKSVLPNPWGDAETVLPGQLNLK